MTDELRPCPFCGGPAVVHEYNGGFASIGCGGQCDFKPSAFGFPSVDSAIEVWNTRAERTCIIINQPDAEGCSFWVCSVCGFPYTDGNNYCPGCGAKVVNNGY